jgi:hypothetical protein
MDTLPFDPSTITRKDLMGVGVGISGIVVHVKGTNIVVKEFTLIDPDQHSERKIYEHLQSQGKGHPNILKYYGRVPPEYELFKGGLLFEYHPRGPLRENLGKLDKIGITEAERSWSVCFYPFFAIFRNSLPNNFTLAGPTRPYQLSPTSIP